MGLTYLVAKWVRVIGLPLASGIFLAWLSFIGLHKVINRGIQDKNPNASPLTLVQLMLLLGPGMSVFGLVFLAGGLLVSHYLPLLFPSALFLIGREIQDNAFLDQIRFWLGTFIVVTISSALLKRLYDS